MKYLKEIIINLISPPPLASVPVYFCFASSLKPASKTCNQNEADIQSLPTIPLSDRPMSTKPYTESPSVLLSYISSVSLPRLIKHCVRYGFGLFGYNLSGTGALYAAFQTKPLLYLTLPNALSQSSAYFRFRQGAFTSGSDNKMSTPKYAWFFRMSIIHC